jgi:hypothetical protein
MTSPSPAIASITLHRPKELVTLHRRPIRLYHLLFFLLYLHQLHWIATTAGRPYQLFLEKAERDGFTVMEGAAKLRAELNHALQDLNDEHRPVDKIGVGEWRGTMMTNTAEGGLDVTQQMSRSNSS